METIAFELAQQSMALGTDGAMIVVLILAAALGYLMLQIIASVGAAVAVLMRGVVNLALPIILIAFLLFLMAGS